MGWTDIQRLTVSLPTGARKGPPFALMTRNCSRFVALSENGPGQLMPHGLRKAGLRESRRKPGRVFLAPNAGCVLDRDVSGALAEQLYHLAPADELENDLSAVGAGRQRRFRGRERRWNRRKAATSGGGKHHEQGRVPLSNLVGHIIVLAAAVSQPLTRRYCPVGSVPPFFFPVHMSVAFRPALEHWITIHQNGVPEPIAM